MMLSSPGSFFSSEDTFITYGVASLVLIIIYIVSFIIMIRIHHGLTALCASVTLFLLVITPFVQQIYWDLSRNIDIARADKKVNSRVEQINNEMIQLHLPYAIDYKLSNRKSNLYKNGTYIRISGVVVDKTSKSDIDNLLKSLSLENTILTFEDDKEDLLFTLRIDNNKKIETCYTFPTPHTFCKIIMDKEINSNE